MPAAERAGPSRKKGAAFGSSLPRPATTQTVSRSKAEDFDLSLDRRPGTAVDSSAKAPKTSSTPSKKALMATAKRLRSATSRDLNARASPAPHPASPWGINGIGRSARLPSRAPQLAAIPDGAPEEAEEDPFEDEAGVFIGCPIEGRFAPRAARPEEDAAVEIAAGGWVPRKAARVTVRRAAAVTPEDLARLSLACPDLRALSLRHARNLSAEDWKSLTGVFPRLRSIGCEGAAQLSKDALAGLVVSKVAAIEALDISRCPALDESSFSALAACTALRILRADHNAWVTNAAVATLSDTAPQLSSLSLRGCERITAAGLPSVAKLRRLAELDLSGIPFRGGAGAVLPILQPLTALSSLALSPVRDAPPSISPHDPPVRGDLAEFWASSHLRRIVSKDVVEESATGVSGWDGATWPLGKEHGVEAIVPLQKMTRLVIRGEKLNLEAFAPLSGLTDLVHLDMAGAHHYTAADLGPLSTLVKLEHIDLSGPGPTSREPLRHIGHLHFVTHCTALRHLDLSGWKGVGPEGLRHLAGVPSLRSLRLRNWDVSSACLLGLSSETTSAKGAKPSGAPLSMLSRLPNLEALDVADPGPATDADLEPVSALTGLTRLRLEGWKDVDFTGAALERLLGLQGLRDLSLARCEFVHDDALAGLARWRRLACLNVSGTGAGKGLLGAIEALMDLEELDVTGTGITRTAVMRALTADAKTTVSRGGLRALWCDEDGEVAVNHRWARAMGRAEYVRAPPSFTLVIRAGLSWASALSHATTLDLSAVQAHLTRDAMDFIGLLAQLKCLVLRNVSFGDIDPLQPLYRLQSLQSLDLSNTNVSNFTLHHLSSLTALEELRLADCRKISGNFVAAIKPLARLRYVNVAGAGKNGRGGEKIAAKVKKRAPKGCVVDSFSLEIAQAIPDWSEAVFRVAMRRLFLDKGGSRPDPSNAVFRDAVATALDPDKREVTDADRTALESNPRLLPFFVDTAAEMWMEIRTEACRILGGKLVGKEIEAALKTSWDLFDAVAADRTPVGERERRFDSWVVQQVVESTVKHFGRKAIAVADAAVLATVPVTLGFLAEMLTAVVFAAQDAKPESHVSFSAPSDVADEDDEPAGVAYGELSSRIRAELQAARAGGALACRLVDSWEDVLQWPGNA